MAYYFQGYQLVAWNWFVVAFSAIVIGIRLYVDFRELRNVPIYRDALVIFALILHIALVAIDSVQNDWGIFDLTESGWQHHHSPADGDKVSKMNWADYIIAFTMYDILKADLLFLYHELAPKKSHPRLFWLIMVGWFLVILNRAMIWVYSLTACKPITDAFRGDRNCQWNASYSYLVWNTHVLSEIAIYIIPLIIINRLKNWTFKQKLSAGWMFLVGLVNVLIVCASIVLQIITRWNLANFSDESWMAMYTYNKFQSGIMRFTAFLVISMPQIKQFYGLLRTKFAGKESGGEEGEVIKGHRGKCTVPRPQRQPRRVMRNMLSSLGIGTLTTRDHDRRAHDTASSSYETSGYLEGTPSTASQDSDPSQASNVLYEASSLEKGAEMKVTAKD